MSSKNEYSQKRDLDESPEPAFSESKKASGDEPVFVIQKHDASNLHYDFRLEIDGVLKSWAIPKGPSTDPSEKRLAIPTEDHPTEYADFEGVIPEGQYGAGTVMVWDKGIFKNIKKKDDQAVSFKKCYEDGQIEVWLEGQKISGGYALVKTSVGNTDDNWLLVKMDDDEADARRNPTSTENKSVKTGRTMKQIKKDARDDE